MLDAEGMILRTSQAFTAGFGYREEELTGRFFGMLFTPADQADGRPEAELQEAAQTGSASNDAYLLHRDGTHLWATGEVLSIRDAGAAPTFIKIVHNIHASALLNQFVLGSGDLIDTVFTSVQDAAMLVIDTRMSILRSNKVFERMFGLVQHDSLPNRLSRLDHPLWRDEAVRHRLRELIVLGKPFESEQFCVATAHDGARQTVRIQSKMLNGLSDGDGGKKFLLVIWDGSPHQSA